MIKLLLLLSIIVIASGSIQWLTGVDSTQKFSSKTTLTKDRSKVPRQLSATVVYQKGFEYEQIPKVFIGIEKMQYQNNSNYVDFKITIDEITKKDFTYTIWINFESTIKNIDVRWVSINDTHVDVRSYEIQTPELDGSDKNLKTFYPIKFDRVYKEAPQVAIYILGANFIKSFNDIQGKVREITTEGANIVITNKQAKVEHVYVQIVIIPSNRGQVVRVGGYFERDKVEYNELVKTFSLTWDFPFDSKYQVGTTVFAFKGFSGFVVDQNLEFAIKIYDQDTENNQYSIKIGYWTGLIAFAWADILFFEPRDDCSFLYDQCDFKGNVVEICRDESLNSFVSTPFETSEIKSVYVPAGMKLQLYNEEKLGGLRATFSESQSCIDKIVADD